MAKKAEDKADSSAKKKVTVKAPLDPNEAKNLIRLLNILAILLVITALVLQLFAVVTHYWKWQVTDLQPIYSPKDRPIQANVYDDSRLEQHYGLFSRNVKVYANHDEQLDVDISTRFPRLDKGDDDLNQCLSRTSTFQGSLLSCSDRFKPLEQCHCRRYPHWNAIIFFEITALVLLGLVVLVCALLSTQYHTLLKLVGLALSLLAFLFLLIGLILILSYLKRETRTIADTYPHVHSRLANHIYQRLLHKVVRRQAHEIYRAYSLSQGQHPYNETHFQQYSEQAREWIKVPYSTLENMPYAPRSQQATTQRATTETRLYNAYGPLVEYDRVYESTRACIGFSTILSIIAMILALLVSLILALSWLKAKALEPEMKTAITTVKTEYVPVSQEVNVEAVPLTTSTAADDGRHGGYMNYGRGQEPVVVRDEQPTTTIQTHHA